MPSVPPLWGGRVGLAQGIGLDVANGVDGGPREELALLVGWDAFLALGLGFFGLSGSFAVAPL